jgi:hypothetical protein
MLRRQTDILILPSFKAVVPGSVRAAAKGRNSALAAEVIRILEHTLRLSCIE